MMADGGKPKKNRPSTSRIANIDKVWRNPDTAYEAHENLRKLYAALENAPMHDVKRLSKYVAPDIVTSTAVKYLQLPERQDVSHNHTRFQLKTSARVVNYAANLLACTQTVTLDDLKRYMKTQSRFDLEQAAAIVTSAMMTAGRIEDATRLVKELGRVLATSCMWVGDHEWLAVNKPDEGPFKGWKVAKQLRESAAHMKQAIPMPSEAHEFLRLLMRVRRCKPENRCLYIPKWIFEAAGIEAPEPFRGFFAGNLNRAPRPGEHPAASVGADSIILSRKHFRHIQRCLFRLFQFWDPAQNHAKRVQDLKDRVLYAGSWIEDRVLATGDVALICHFFFHYQRRLQQRVVGNHHGGFLAKGEGSQIYQNNVSIQSTFERVLEETVDSNEMGVLVTAGKESTLNLIDETCLLMKEYVDIYGDGKTENLVFKKGVRGGSGRGPVDRYNLLCTVLSQLREQAKDEGVEDLPGPTRKFLAKDIMYWNNGWEDDAFAGAKEPGWKGWLRKRGLAEDEDWVMTGNDVEGDSMVLALR